MNVPTPYIQCGVCMCMSTVTYMVTIQNLQVVCDVEISEYLFE